ncbi:MAG: DUF4388 domain-containing protein [Planctomycetes bacterium]|nr:DUF4388 domain-containing protein [Planctomycetota bacterium]
MDLHGSLDVLEPAMVFQSFHTWGLTGLLKFVNPGKFADFYLRNGSIIFATLERKKKIGEYLLEKGAITEKQLKKALNTFRHEKGLARLGEILVERRYISQETLSKMIQEQMREIIYEVMTWQGGAFLFFNGLEPEEEDVFLDQRMDHLILEGCRRLDESLCPTR